MQHQKAFDVHDPMILSARLEALIGTSTLEEKIAETASKIVRLDAEMLQQDGMQQR